MIVRSLNESERKVFKWKVYPFTVTGKTTRYDIVNFVNSKLINTGETDQGLPVFIDTITTEIIIITKDGEKIPAQFNHIYKGNLIRIRLNGLWYPWSKIKAKIDKIIFMDNLTYHKAAKTYWSKGGFSYNEFYKGLYMELIQELTEQAGA